MKGRREDLDRLYELLAELELRCGGTRHLSDCTRSMGWPRRGVYFFFEHGEPREDGLTPRVVRVGTHALRPSKTTLWDRLSQHRGAPGGSMPGGGNHRGSIFRLHLGTALLATGEWPESLRGSWAKGQSAPREVRVSEYPIEKAVSDYIGRMPFLWVGVDDPPTPMSDRGVIERGAIALLSNLGRSPIDRASATWLGRHADRADVRDSGLWNVNHVRESSDGGFLAPLAAAVARRPSLDP
jgi:hypothetical protein